MMTLTHVFKTRPSALRLHRKLTQCLARGDSARSADLAATLADVVRHCAGPPSDREAPPPAPGADDIAASVELTRRGLLSRDPAGAAEALLGAADESAESDPAADTSGTSGTSAAAAAGPLSFLTRPESLRVTLLESSFETTLPPGAGDDPLTGAGARAEAHERERLALLDAYLSREARRWAAQKSALAHGVLATARRAGLTPAALHAAANRAAPAGDGRLCVLRHCNVIVRGEPPDATDDGPDEMKRIVDAELEVLAQRMADSGAPLSPRDREMARCELVLTKSSMRYVVGVHHELQAALDAECSGGAAAFVQNVVALLNGDEKDAAETDMEDAERRSVLVAPVLPFTFMLKMCLWFDVPREDDNEEVD